MTKDEKIELKTALETIKRNARKNFWEFEQYLYPNFFKDSRPHLKILADTLQQLYEGALLINGEVCRKLIINIPPRLGKSFTLILFSAWVLGRENQNRIITVSYNDTLSNRFSKAVRDTIEFKKVDALIECYSDIFPRTKIKSGDAASGLWSLEGQFFNYLGTSIMGTITGMGANIGIIDDPIKSKEEAFNDRVLESHFDFYKNTFLSRMEKNNIQIINQTRWGKNDLAGKLLEQGCWFNLVMEDYNEVLGEMLCSELRNKQQYDEVEKTLSPEIFMANYHQRCVDIQGKLYKKLKTYSTAPEFEMIKNYTDTADEGSDYLCSISYGVKNKEAYIIDVYYTKEGMEITEQETAKRLIDNNVNLCKIESNAGGRSFARNIDRILKEVFKNNRSVITWFHQSQNKRARILSNSAWVQEHIYFPENWHLRWAKFYQDVTGYQKDGKNKNDDAPDVLTGIAEDISKPAVVFY